jgi:hypothetical protein
MSPVISTLVVLGIALVVAGITYTWTATYVPQQTKSFQEATDVNTLVQKQTAIGLTLESASTTGKLIVANNSSQSLTINQVMVDGTLKSIPPVSIPAGGVASIDANTSLAEGQSISLITTAGASKTITVTSEAITQYLSTALFSDPLNNKNYLNSGRTDANIIDGEARLKGYPAWIVLKNVAMSDPAYLVNWPSLALDANGNPSIAWQYRDGTIETYYRDWNGSDWTVAAGTLSGSSLSATGGTGTGNAEYPSLALDANGNPSIAWNAATGASTGEVYYVDWNGTNWVTAAGTLGGSSLTVSVNTPTGYSWYPSLVLDVNGNPSIAWIDEQSGNSEVYYRDWNGTNWVTVSGSIGTRDLNVSNVSWDSVGKPSLALDANGNPSISWSGSNPLYWWSSDIYYRDWNGTDWTTVRGNLYDDDLNVSSNYWNSIEPSLTLDINGNPSIAWLNYVDDPNYPAGEIFYRDWNGTNWATAAGDLSGPSLDISNSVGTMSQDPSLALDVNGNPSMAWDEGGKIYYRDWNRTDWATVTGTLTGSLSASGAGTESVLPSLALDAGGMPSIAWKQGSIQKIYYREWDENFSLGNRVESIEVDPVSTHILSATLTASTSMPIGTLIRFFLSNDNGSTWLPTTPGPTTAEIQVDFNSIGSQLKWRADLNSTSSRVTSRIYDVNISYVHEA